MSAPRPPAAMYNTAMVPLDSRAAAHQDLSGAGSNTNTIHYCEVCRRQPPNTAEFMELPLLIQRKLLHCTFREGTKCKWCHMSPMPPNHESECDGIRLGKIVCMCSHGRRKPDGTIIPCCYKAGYHVYAHCSKFSRAPECPLRAREEAAGPGPPGGPGIKLQ